VFQIYCGVVASITDIQKEIAINMATCPTNYLAEHGLREIETNYIRGFPKSVFLCVRIRMKNNITYLSSEVIVQNSPPMNLEMYDVCDLKVERCGYNRRETFYCSFVHGRRAYFGSTRHYFSLPGSFYENMFRPNQEKTQKVEAVAMDEFSRDCL
jgi:hypothetical protein